MFSIIKVFTIKNQPDVVSDVAVLLNNFYQILLDDGHVNSSITVENFITELQQVKAPFLESKKFINQTTQNMGNNSILWQADFDSAESYTEYKTALNGVFGTDFHMIIDSPNISLDIIE
jgi:hypothetical protein